MSHSKFLPISCLLSVLLASLTITTTHAITFTVKNNCPYKVWAASANPGGGREMNSGDTWTVTANPGQQGGRIWARTGCTATGPNGLKCTTGDCGGLLQCKAYGTPPNTLAEFGLKGFNDMDFFDISLVDGFNVPMSFLPVNGCSKGPTCKPDLIGPCPAQLKTSGGCNNPCPTEYSKYFKGKCPDAYSYPKDDATSTYACPTGTNYRVTFCP
ncbi:Zeamatin [Bienertia sinuspersici]